jgi:hypothetical protein
MVLVLELVKEKYIDTNENISIYVIDIKELSGNLIKAIDNSILRIWEGRNPYGTTIQDVKLKIKNFLEKKQKEDAGEQSLKLNTIYMGAVAEFFIHVFLNSIGYEQECLFKNLEERSIKKGFDGYYSHDNETWIVESKSGMSTTENISHLSKLDEAYGQLKHKITTSSEKDNNPWENAFNHAKLADSNETILMQLKKYSNQFTNNQINNNIKDFNLIPCSTIFYFQDWEENKEEIIEDVKTFANKHTFSKLIAICINKKSANILMKYLEGENG